MRDGDECWALKVSPVACCICAMVTDTIAIAVIAGVITVVTLIVGCVRMISVVIGAEQNG